jgi:hypothetical protein
VFAVLTECERAAYRPGPAELEALCLMAPDRRAAFVVEQKARTILTEQVRSAGRNPGGGSAGAGRMTEGRPAADGKEFLGRVMG